MAADIDRHTRLVGLLKILLPLAALGLLSTLFLFARRADVPSTIPFSELDRMAREQQIAEPSFSGVTTDGSVISITAAAAKPGTEGDMTIDAPRLTLDATDGTRLSITAGAGALNTNDQTALLTGLARVETSSGYVMETSGMTADLASGEVNSIGPLAIRAPYGSLTAGAVTITAPPDGTGQRMDFTQGVKLVYTPRPRDP